MNTSSWSGLTVGRVRRIAAAVVLLAAPCMARAGDDPKEKLPEVTREHLLSKVPHFFYFDYPAEPQPGKRIWLRVDDTHWVERYPDGLESKFKILGRGKAGETEGVIAAKISGDEEKTTTVNDGSFQVFIPDKSEGEMRFRFRFSDDGEWNDLAEMKKVE